MTKIGIHFGLNQVSPAAYGGWPGYLQGCIRDATSLAAILAELGYDAKAYFDQDCTLNSIRQQLTDAAKSLVAGDTLVFSQSSHGGQSLGVLTGTTETLCMFDGQLADSELRSMLAQFKPGVSVAILLDSCHSGGMDRAMKRVRVAPLFVTKSLPVLRMLDATIQANVLLLAACQRDETAEDGDMNGAFTGSLLNCAGEGLTWQQWFDATARLMSKDFPSQHPQLLTLNGSLSGHPVSPDESPAIVGTA